MKRQAATGTLSWAKPGFTTSDQPSCCNRGASPGSGYHKSNGARYNSAFNQVFNNIFPMHFPPCRIVMSGLSCI